MGEIMGLFKKNKNKNKEFEEILYLNNSTYWYYYNLLEDIFLNLITYENLPESMDGEFIEKILFYHPGISFFEDEVYGEIVHLPFNQLGRPNFYDYPIRIQAYSDNGYHNTLEDGNFTVMYANSIRQPPCEAISLFAYRLANIERTTDVNLENQKNPKIMVVNERNKLAVDNMMMKIKGNYPHILVKPELKVENFDILDLTVPYVGDKLDIHKHNILNDFLTFCGIENGTRDKKQSMTNDEVNGNWGNVEACRNTRLKSRRVGIEKVNKKWGFDIHVRFNSEIPSLLNRHNMEEQGLGHLYNNLARASINSQ